MIDKEKFVKMMEDYPPTNDSEVMKERLPPELRSFVHPDIYFTMFRHPLYQVPYFKGSGVEVDGIVKGIAQKERAIAEALGVGDYERVVTLHERPFRFTALLGLLGDESILDDSEKSKAFVSAMRYVWVDTENIYSTQGAWQKLWLKVRSLPFSAGDDEDRDLYLKVTEKPTFPVYRGTTHNIRGMSWTTSKAVAEWFATRGGYRGDVYKINAKREHVMSCFAGRGESEVVLSLDYVRRTKIEKL